MSKKVNRVGKLFLRFIATASLLAAPSLASAQCVVGGTNFDTKVELCSPKLDDDTTENGWFYKKLGETLDALCDGSYSEVVTNVTKLGMTSGALSTKCSNDFSAYMKATSGNVANAADGYAQVVGNARVVSPYFIETDNILVQGGTGSNNALLTYSLTGLKPGSSVTFTCDVFSLWDLEAMEKALTFINEGADKAITSIALPGGYKFEMQTQGSALRPGTGAINGNKPTVVVCTGGIANTQPQGKYDQQTFKSWGEKITLKVSATVDETGKATFTMGRNGGGEFAPIGIDNIKIVGDIQPEIYAQKSMPLCPANPVLLGLKQSFPEGTKFEWSGLGEKSTTQTFVVTPAEADKTYPVTCKVTMGECSATAKIDVLTKECCSMKNEQGQDVPVAETNVFFDDFGYFPDNKTYAYTDQLGVEHTMAVDGGQWTDVTRPFVCFMQDGVTTPGLKSAKQLNSQAPDGGGWMITAYNPYQVKGSGDATNNGAPGNGGMFIVDLSGSGHAGRVVYQRTVDGLCKGKEITFSAMFSAINIHPSLVAELKILLRKGSATGPILYEKSSGVLTSPKWEEAGTSFVLDEDINTVVLQVINVADSYGTDQGDFAIDNIKFTVCTPPDVAVESSLTAEELLDLCTDKPLTLNAQISETAKAYYNNKEGYLFQYTYTNPATTEADKIVWKDLSDIQSDGSFTIESPADNEAFEPLKAAAKGDLNVYFRVVIGEHSYLSNNRSEWESLSALSPCRAISISSIPIVAALNCAKCYTPKKVNIVDKSEPDNKAVKALTLCPNDKLNLSAVVSGETDDGEPYSGYYLYWKKNNEIIESKLPIYSKTAGGKAVTPAEDVVVENDGSYKVATDVTYRVIAVDTFEFTSLKDAFCKDSFEVKVTMLPQPEVKDEELKYCFGAPEADDVLPTGKAGEVINYYESLADAEAGTPSVEEPALATLAAKDVPYVYYYTLTNANGCVSEPAKVSITVHEIPVFEVPAITPPSFCAGQYIEAGATVADENYELMQKDPDDKYDITWTPVTAGASTKINTMKGNVDEYKFTYVVSATYGTLVCKAKAQDYSVKVDPAVVIETLDTKKDECDLYVLDVKVNPSDAIKKWTGDGFDVDDTFQEMWEKAFVTGKITLEATKEGYCPASKDLKVTTKKSPIVFTADPVTMVKMLQYKQPKTLKEACNNLSPDLAVDDANLASCLELVYTQTASKTQVTDPKLLTYAQNIPTPQATNSGVEGKFDATKEIQYYYVRIHNTCTDCYSEPTEVVVTFYGAPIPEVKNSSFCKGVVTATTLADYVTTTKASETDVTVYTPHIYKEDKTTELTGADLAISTSQEGVTTYWATQSSIVEGEYSESEAVPFTVTVYGVAAPTIDKTQPHYNTTYNQINYCLNDEDVSNLQATQVVDESKFLFSSGLEWSTEKLAIDARGVASLKPSVNETGSTDYFVRQYYTILATGDICVGEPVSITVNVDATPAPTGTMSVLYLYNDLETNGHFENLLVQDKSVVDDTDDSGYLFEYAVADAAGNVTGTWSTDVPTPAAVDRSELANEPKIVYYKVRRTKTDPASGKCPSEEKLITVTITDSPTPAVTPAYFCEGETIPALDAYAKTTGTTKIPATGYTLLWYGSTKPAATEMESGSETAPASQVANVDATGKTTTYTYYVAQRENESKAIGSPIALVITVYPKPVQTIATVNPVCETAVDLSSAVSFNKEVSSASYVTKYFSDAAGTSEISKSVSESNTYYAQTSFATPSASIAGSVCASTVDPVEVTIETLELTKVVDAETCPNTEGLLHAEINTNVETASFSWKAQKGTDAKLDVNKSGSSDFTTAKLEGKAGDTFLYDLTVTAGTCTESQSGIVVTLGDGPVVGTLTLDESENTNTGKVYTSTRDVTADPFYMCGKGITATVDLTKDPASEFSWTNAAGSTVGSGSTATINAPGVYTISYSNKCATSMTFEVKDASIKSNAAVLASGPLNKAAEGETLVICEKEPMEMTLTYVAGNDASTVTWTKDNAATTIVSGKSTSIAKATPEHSGVYEYTITNYGCTATGSVDAKVKPYIQFAPAATQYVARRDSQLTIPTKISVPAAGAPSNISWTNKAGAEVNTTQDFLYTVSASDVFTIIMSDDDYCDATATVEVIKDARLQLGAKLDEKMCRGDKGVLLKIDTAGTGDIYYKKKAKITVIETIGEASRSYSQSDLRLVNDTLVMEVHPTADATYTINFVYREGEGVDEQKVSTDLDITVLQPIQIKVPTGLSVCAGDELEISLLSVTPEGSVVVNWQDDASITSATSDTETITVTPEYDEETGRNHNSTKVYNLVASMDGCADKKEKVTITVNEPITGELVDDTICEGQSVRLDASSFKASTYLWTTPSVGNAVGSSQTVLVTPEATSVYTVEMTRGNCKAEAEMTVNVNSNPKIVSVDSVSYRDVHITLDESFGTPPFSYAVDDINSFDSNPDKEKLTYTVHTAFVKDDVGCTATLPFNVKRPLIQIPAWFSPNGDNVFDYWKPTSIQQTYPEAVIKVFDRWGKLLATFSGESDGWDGTYKGKPMPSTDYWYEVTIHEIDKVFTGHFTLIRR